MEKIDRTILRIKDLHLQYADTQVLKGVDLQLGAGEILGLMGASGSGKTSLLRAVAGFEKASRGEVFIDNQCVCSSDVTKPCAQRSVGFVFQDLALFPHMTVQENLLYGAKTEKHRLRGAELAETFAIKPHFAKKPHQLSGGEKQRLALARSLVPGPRLLMMDEPFTGLDAHLRQSLLPSIRASLKSLAVPTILVSHSFEELSMMADRLAVMDEGKLVQIGPLEDIYFRPVNKLVAQLSGPMYLLPAKLYGNRGSTEFGEVQCTSNSSSPVELACRQEDFLEMGNGSGTGIDCKVIDQHFYQGSFRVELITPRGFRFQLRRNQRITADSMRVSLNMSRLYTSLE